MGSIIFESGTSTDKIIEMDKAIEIFNANGNKTIKNIKAEGNTNIQDIKQDYDNLKKIVIDENNAANLQNQVNQIDSQLSENEKSIKWGKFNIQSSIRNIGIVLEGTDIKITFYGDDSGNKLYFWLFDAKNNYTAFSIPSDSNPYNRWRCTLKNWEMLILDTITKSFAIKPYTYIIPSYQILLGYNVDGNIKGGWLAEQIEYYKSMQGLNTTSLNPELRKSLADKIPYVWDEYYTREDSTNVAFITDIHSRSYGYYTRNCTNGDSHWKSYGIDIINEVDKQLGLDLIINGGDATTFTGKPNADKQELSYTIGSFENKEKVIYCKGNHDDLMADEVGLQTFEGLLFPNTLFNITMRHQKNNPNITWGDKGGMYYAYDIPNSNVRFIILNSSDIHYLKDNETGWIQGGVHFAYKQEQISWLANIALNTDKHCIIVTHIPLLNNSQGMTGNFGMPKNNDIILKILEAFKTGTAVNITGSDTRYPASINKDFSQQTSRNLVCVLSGHIHLDRVVDFNGIKHISVLSEFPRSWEGQPADRPVRLFGTYSQLAFDILTITPSKRNCKFLRVGAVSGEGSNRGEKLSFSY